MTHVFDGIAPALTGVLGADVTILPAGGGPITVRAVLRDTTVETEDDEGNPVILSMTVLRIPRPNAGVLDTGDTVLQGALQYRVRHKVPSDSPADNRFDIFVLEKT